MKQADLPLSERDAIIITILGATMSFPTVLGDIA